MKKEKQRDSRDCYNGIVRMNRVFGGFVFSSARADRIDDKLLKKYSVAFGQNHSVRLKDHYYFTNEYRNYFRYLINKAGIDKKNQFD